MFHLFLKVTTMKSKCILFSPWLLGRPGMVRVGLLPVVCAFSAVGSTKRTKLRMSWYVGCWIWRRY